MTATAKSTTGASYRYGSLVSGTWHDETLTFETSNPAQPSQIVGTYGSATHTRLHAAGDAAVAAQREWGRLPSMERAKVVGRFLDAVEARTEETPRSPLRANRAEPLGEARGEIGKSIREARCMLAEDISDQLDFRRQCAARGSKHRHETSARGDSGNYALELPDSHADA